jgi:hypothetical protein
MRIDRFQHDDALRTAIKKLAYSDAANYDRRPREALPARNTRAPEALGPGEARGVD